MRVLAACYARITDSSEGRLTATDRQSINVLMRAVTVICFAIFAAVPIYIVVAYVVVSQNPAGFASGVGPAAVWVIAAMAVVQVPVAAVVSGNLKRSAAAKPTVAERLASFRVATIVGFALRESTAVMGLVITLLTGDLRWCLGLGALAAVSMAMAWPRRAEVEKLTADPATAPIG